MFCLPLLCGVSRPCSLYFHCSRKIRETQQWDQARIPPSASFSFENVPEMPQTCRGGLPTTRNADFSP
jgi:hypothetical protein